MAKPVGIPGSLTPEYGSFPCATPPLCCTFWVTMPNSLCSVGRDFFFFLKKMIGISVEDPLEKEMATCPSILPWEISRTEEPGGLHVLF